jgi:hypothetical protein
MYGVKLRDPFHPKLSYFVRFKIVMNIVNFSSSESAVDFNFKRVIEKFILPWKIKFDANSCTSSRPPAPILSNSRWFVSA